MEWAVRGQTDAYGCGSGAVAGWWHHPGLRICGGHLSILTVESAAGFCLLLFLHEYDQERAGLHDSLDASASTGSEDLVVRIADGSFATKDDQSAGADGPVFGNTGSVWLQSLRSGGHGTAFVRDRFILLRL